MNNEVGKLPGPGSRALVADSRTLRQLGPLGAVADAPGGNAEGAFNINELLRIVLKWRWLILGTILASVLAAIVLSLIMTPVYRASVILEINREPVQILGENRDAQPVSANDPDFITTQVGLLQSRSLAERVAQTLNLAGNEELVDPDAPRAAREAQAVGQLRSNFAVEPQRNSRLLTLSFESTSPALAARVVDAYADNFINSNLERRYEANTFARNFLQRRIAQVKERLETSERQLVDYATRQGIILLGSGGSAPGEGGSGEQSLDAASLIQLNEALSEARSDRIAAEQRFRASQGVAAATSTVNNPTIQGLTGQRAELQAEYQQKLSQFQPDYPEMLALRARIDSLSRAIATESGRVGSTAAGGLRADYQAALARENALQARVTGLKGSVQDLRRRSIQYNIIQREVDTNRAQYDALLQRFKEIGVVGGIGTNLVSVVDRADVPGSPISPNLPLNVLAGLALGLLLGFGAAFAIEFVDDTIKTPDDLTNKLGLTPLGLIPRGPKDMPLLEVIADPRAPVTEAYQSVRTALQFASDHGVPKSLLVTSTRAAEGKSSTSMALAQSFARLGANVLLIDSDLRKPSFRAPTARVEGLSNLLAGADNVRECIHETKIERLFLLPSGPIPPNPAELLASDRLARIMAEVSEWFDLVVVDAPPVLGLADAPLLGAVCEGTIMAFEAGKVRRGMALNAVNRMRAANAHLIGGILTKFNTKSSGYGYGYAYADDAYTYGVGQERQRQIELVG